MAAPYRVIYLGYLNPGTDKEAAITAFAAKFKAPENKVRELIESDEERIIKSNLSEDESEKYLEVLETMGLAVRRETDEFSTDASSAVKDEPNPFAAPQAELEQPSDGGELHEPRSVNPGRGWAWIREGFSMVFKNPGVWIGAVLIWTVISIVLNLIPLVSFITALFSSVVLGGLMYGAHQQYTGEALKLEHLIIGFKEKFGPLFLVGVIYLLSFIALGIIAGLSTFLLISNNVEVFSDANNIPFALMSNPVIWLIFLVALAVMVPLVMAYWFAPALVILDGLTTTNAMATSFRACLKNILPFLVYGLCALILSVLGALPLFLGLILVLPVIVASIYTSYRDIFRD